MSYLKERVAYLRGLAEGMQISDASNEGKLLKAILEVLDDVALAVDDVEEVQEQLSEQVDNIDEDLAEIERVIFDEEDEDDELCFAEIECPYCNETISVDEDMIDDDGETIECPNCHKQIELEWECGCEECEGHDEE
ncbi:MAG: zinc-ribbon domain-containing protein [Clostridia bacterium]|nr:zinc-ribbon domain-containing protein [Clostridia bacterium]